MTDIINKPPHYNTGKIEVISYIEDKGLGFHLGNAVKYISRAGHKDPSKYIEDLKKAVWYVEREINRAQVRETELSIKRENKDQHLIEVAHINWCGEKINKK
jgi:hypothetical protein